MGTARLAPIFSDRDEDPELSVAIDAFVIGLGEWIDALQDAHAQGDLTGVAERAEAQAGEAEALGYPGLRDVAGEVGAAARAGDETAARKAISDLIEIVQRIRLGHRSAA